MPANLSPEYKRAEERYRASRTPEEKLDALHEMLSTIPKHKGTEKMQADIKRRIAKYSEGSGKKGAKRFDFYFVPKEGAGQVILVGAPNSGKSSLLATVTNAHPVIGDYPYSTSKPIWGMMFFENVQIQLVDLPPISEDYTEGWVFGIIRNADVLVFVVDLSDDELLEQYSSLIENLGNHKIIPQKEITEDFDDPAIKQIRTFVIASKSDKVLDNENMELLDLEINGKFEIFKTIADKEWNSNEFKRKVFEYLEVIRVYTKEPGKDADKADPVILHGGAKLKDFAKSIHKDFSVKLKYARIWGEDVYPGQKVQHDFELRDEDIIELHIK
ncbi:50S ribosome-binding GTPase [Candidatus Dependentiae bacterium]|nr:50S ribosome-binding GTPase [Candidatus Dependentiae bacterium]